MLLTLQKAISLANMSIDHSLTVIISHSVPAAVLAPPMPYGAPCSTENVQPLVSLITSMTTNSCALAPVTLPTSSAAHIVIVCKSRDDMERPWHYSSSGFVNLVQALDVNTCDILKGLLEAPPTEKLLCRIEGGFLYPNRNLALPKKILAQKVSAQ